MTRSWAMLLALLAALVGVAAAGQDAKPLNPKQKRLLAELKACPFKIVWETYRNKNWDLMVMDADGANKRNVTHTPDIDEMYPHASPDGTKLLFVADQRKDGKRTHEAFCMAIDGTGPRTKVGTNARQPFWSPDSKVVGYMRGVPGSFSESGSGLKGLYFVNIETGKEWEHPRKGLTGLLNLCWSSDGKWLVCTARGSGFADAIAAFEANGTKAYEIARCHQEAKNVYRCRPDISPDGRHVTWGKCDVNNHFGLGVRTMWVETCDVDLNSPNRKGTHFRQLVTDHYPWEFYHVDWSPDGKYIVYGRGERGKGRMAGSLPVIGRKAPTWDIWVVKVAEPEVVVQLTHDGLSNKEPDWVPVAPR